MPSKKKVPVNGSPEWPLPEIPKEVIGQFVDAHAAREVAAPQKTLTAALV